MKKMFCSFPSGVLLGLYLNSQDFSDVQIALLLLK